MADLEALPYHSGDAPGYCRITCDLLVKRLRDLTSCAEKRYNDVGQCSDISLALAMLGDSKLLLILSTAFEEHVKEPWRWEKKQSAKFKRTFCDF